MQDGLGVGGRLGQRAYGLGVGLASGGAGPRVVVGPVPERVGQVRGQPGVVLGAGEFQMDAGAPVAGREPGDGRAAQPVHAEPGESGQLGQGAGVDAVAVAQGELGQRGQGREAGQLAGGGLPAQVKAPQAGQAGQEGRADRAGAGDDQVAYGGKAVRHVTGGHAEAQPAAVLGRLHPGDTGDREQIERVQAGRQPDQLEGAARGQLEVGQVGAAQVDPGRRVVPEKTADHRAGGQRRGQSTVGAPARRRDPGAARCRSGRAGSSRRRA